jgi:hypothetical protein
MGEIMVMEVMTKKDRKKFIYLPEKVHKNEKSWLPPIYMDEWLLFNPKKNNSYKYADTILYLAYDGNKVVGRIMGIINNRYNNLNNEPHGRFCFIECFNDQKIAHALISKVEEWAKSRGMLKIVGPLGFSDKDPQGLQIEGFEYSQVMTAPTNSEYLPGLVVNEGYEKKIDLVNYIAPMPDQLPPLYEKILTRVGNNPMYKTIEFASKNEIKPYIIDVLELMNETFAEIYGFVPLTEKEKLEFAGRYLPILDPAFVKVVISKGEVIGFAIGMPDISAGLRKSGGKLFPFGLFQILKSSRESKKLLMLLGGVKKDYRGQGIDVLMGVKILQSGIKNKMEVIDSHLVLETNSRMRSEYERIGGKVVKKFRIYQKDLV